jgi:hypothetical protein
VSRATQGSLWADTQKSDEESRTPEIDLSELESLFSVSMPNTEAKRTRERPSVAAKQEKVHLVLVSITYFSNFALLDNRMKTQTKNKIILHFSCAD